MYKGIGEAAYNDGLFSQTAPFQSYQASTNQFAEGSLGATARVLPDARFLVARHQASRRRLGAGSRRPLCPAPRDPGAQAAWRAGYCPPHSIAGLGRAFLPSFNPHEMSGLGYVYRDGVLGATALPSASSADYAALLVTPAMKIDTATLNQRVDGVKRVTVQLAIGLGVVALGVGYLFAKR